MRWQIYLVFEFFCVISSLCKPTHKDTMNDSFDLFQDYCRKVQPLLEQELKKTKNDIREALFRTNNEISIQEISTDEGYEIPEKIKPMIEQIFPDSTEIYFIKDILKNLKEIKDKNTKKIIKKLEKFNENEYISLRNFVQISTNEYIKVSKLLVGLFNNFLKRFHYLDTSNTGLISKNDFSSVLEAVLKNRDIIKHVLKPFESVKNLNYEAWLLKKRKVAYELINPPNNMIDENEADEDETDEDETDESDINEIVLCEAPDMDEIETDESEMDEFMLGEVPDIDEFDKDESEMDEFMLGEAPDIDEFDKDEDDKDDDNSSNSSFQQLFSKTKEIFKTLKL
ncbi:uncharacterized protein LOC126909577 [Daktulosphaira vitifoliae]|uniref:uncharacterized protein LOC126909577 n=1 Tax=Daktulosphaira vitifoliae TaxID=58002 RepID=UPI0021AAE5C0|nr:uncharacterized protein LOC126909577 [Daktulosphaira vitifoliae]